MRFKSYNLNFDNFPYEISELHCTGLVSDAEDFMTMTVKCMTSTIPKVNNIVYLLYENRIMKVK